MRSPELKHRYIVVEGPIGVGKTTLTRALSKRFAARSVFEIVEENPFLPEFYKDKVAHAFKTQMFFLLSRFKQQEALLQGDLFQGQVVSDYLFAKDRLFAALTLSPAELVLYERVDSVRQPRALVFVKSPRGLAELREVLAPVHGHFDAPRLAFATRWAGVWKGGIEDRCDPQRIGRDCQGRQFAVHREGVNRHIQRFDMGNRPNKWRQFLATGHRRDEGKQFMAQIRAAGRTVGEDSSAHYIRQLSPAAPVLYLDLIA